MIYSGAPGGPLHRIGSTYGSRIWSRPAGAPTGSTGENDAEIQLGHSCACGFARKPGPASSYRARHSWTPPRPPC